MSSEFLNSSPNHKIFLFKILNPTPFSSNVPAFAEAKPYAKLLYDGGYVIAEGYDARKIDYYYQESWDGGYFALSSQDNHTTYDTGMLLNRSLIKQSPGFAVETSEDGYQLDFAYCMKQSDEKLKYLIVSCGRTIILRALTEEERAQIQQYKKEQQGKPYTVSDPIRIQALNPQIADHFPLLKQCQRNLLR